MLPVIIHLNFSFETKQIMPITTRLAGELVVNAMLVVYTHLQPILLFLPHVVLEAVIAGIMTDPSVTHQIVVHI